MNIQILLQKTSNGVSITQPHLDDSVFQIELKDDSMFDKLIHIGQQLWNRGIVLEGSDWIGIQMVLDGCFSAWDIENSEPIDFPKIFRLSELPEGATFANIAVELGIFPSLTQARKNGFDRPLTLGEHILTKKKIRISITE